MAMVLLLTAIAKFYHFEIMCTWGGVGMGLWAHCLWSPGGSAASLELELQVVVSFSMWVLGSKLRTTTGKDVLSPAPIPYMLPSITYMNRAPT